MTSSRTVATAARAAAPGTTSTSATGTGSGRSSSDSSGFTLVELLTVLALVSVLLALTAPSLKGFSEARRLKAAGESIAHLCFFARDIAETEGEAYVVVFDLDDQRYWLAHSSALEYGDLSQTIGIGAFEQEDDGMSGTSNPGELPPSRALGVLGQARDVTHGATLERIDVDREGAVTGTVTGMNYIVFGNQGTAEPASVYLTDTDGRGVAIDVPRDAARLEVRSLSEDEISDLGLSAGA